MYVRNAVVSEKHEHWRLRRGSQVPPRQDEEKEMSGFSSGPAKPGALRLGCFGPVSPSRPAGPEGQVARTRRPETGWDLLWGTGAFHCSSLNDQWTLRVPDDPRPESDANAPPAGWQKHCNFLMLKQSGKPKPTQTLKNSGTTQKSEDHSSVFRSFWSQVKLEMNQSEIKVKTA